MGGVRSQSVLGLRSFATSYEGLLGSGAVTSGWQWGERSRV